MIVHSSKLVKQCRYSSSKSTQRFNPNNFVFQQFLEREFPFATVVCSGVGVPVVSVSVSLHHFVAEN